MSSLLKKNTFTRGFMRKQVTEISKIVQGDLAAKSENDKAVLMSRIETLYESIGEIDKLIFDAMFESSKEEELQKELETVASYNETIVQCKVILKDALADQPAVSVPVSSAAHPKLKAPIAPLPTFSGEPTESLERFLNAFEAVVDKYSYSPYEKFIILRKQTLGRARILLNSIEATKESYDDAKDLLKEAFASPIVQKFDAIQRLIDLKFPYGRDPFSFVSDIRVTQELFSTLKLQISDVLQFFIWKAMNTTLQNQFINITNENRPSLENINKNLFLAIERYQSMSVKYDDKSKSSDKRKDISASTNGAATASYAVDVKSRSKKSFEPCSLCGANSGHPIYKCDKYCTPKEKLDKLKSLKGCSSCSYLNHGSADCKFKFRNKCKHCSGNHFSFLCLQSQVSSTPDTGVASGSGESTAGVVWTQGAYHSRLNKQNVLPTFTCSLGNSDGVRAMYDTGCQTNFVLEKFVKANNFPVVGDGIKLTINGFNSSRIVDTNIVSIPIGIGSQTYNIEAVSIPNIDLNLSLPALGDVVSMLKSKGYPLADKYLDSLQRCISEIGLMLGSESPHCIPVSTRVFGCDKPSALLFTPHGIMLQGSIETLLENIPSLPVFDPKIDCADDKFYLPLNCNSHNSKQTSTNNCAFVNAVVVGSSDDIDPNLIDIALDDLLNTRCSDILEYDNISNEEREFVNDELVNFALTNTIQLPDGRLQMPLLWNSKVAHLLGRNTNLAKKILQSNLRKLSKIPNGLSMTDRVFKEQEESGIIERICNLEQFIEEHPTCSFLPHMSVFRPDKETTKCRVVYLSNLCEKKFNSVTLCHNQTIHSGPNLNKKLSISLFLLRFDKFVLTFDVKKAFLNIAMSEIDQCRLLLLWYRNIDKKDFEIVAYKAKRLPFGISCSPALLMLALYKILILDVEGESDNLIALKKLVYSLMYVDNGAFTSNCESEVNFAYENLSKIFAPYQFYLQQYVTNCSKLQNQIDTEEKIITPEESKLFGLIWNKDTDKLFPVRLSLDSKAKTKRKCLKTFAENFDPFNISGPLLNRARLFIHALQSDPELKWDDTLSDSKLREWINICRQVNQSPVITIPRYIGSRSATYNLICCTDASKSLYGYVIYIQNVDTRKTDFVMSKSRVICKSLQSKGIPSLEFQAVCFGAESLIKLYIDLTNDKSVIPINIHNLFLYTDSMVSLSWLSLYHAKMAKMQSKRSVFVMNRLSSVGELCETHSITFKFIMGTANPADFASRPVSYKLLTSSNYLSGPKYFTEKENRVPVDDMSVTLPVEEHKRPTGVIGAVQGCFVTSCANPAEHLIPLNKFSRLAKLIFVLSYVIKFVYLKFPDKFPDPSKLNLIRLARVRILSIDQSIHFPECINFFNSKSKKLKDIPNIVNQLNVYMDSDGLLRVRSKFRVGIYDPVLLSRSSDLVTLIVSSRHIELSHAGKYTLLSDLRKLYYVSKFFSLVKRVVRSCVICGRFNEKPIQVNQSPYRDFRANPPSIPYRSIFIDHLGPYLVKLKENKVKVWVLCITCLWSRAVNLKVCSDLSLGIFLRALQLHVNEFGLPGLILSDSGSQLTAAANVLTDFFKDAETQRYLDENGIEKFEFINYYKGNNSLGSLVEICVKFVKRLIHGSIGKNVLDYFEFELIISNVVSLVNKRPIAFKEALRDDNVVDVPEPISPELLVRGFSMPSINVVPSMAGDDLNDPIFAGDVGRIRDTCSKLKQVRDRLIDIYNNEFKQTLVVQSTNCKQRYKPVFHKKLSIGDVVLLKEKHMKAGDYPMGVVRDIQVNDLDEVTGATVFKGRSRELVKRHVNSLILLMRPVAESSEAALSADGEPPDASGGSVDAVRSRPLRAAAAACGERNRELLQSDLA